MKISLAQNFPRDVLIEIFGYLSKEDLKASSSACKLFYTITHDERLVQCLISPSPHLFLLPQHLIGQKLSFECIQANANLLLDYPKIGLDANNRWKLRAVPKWRILTSLYNWLNKEIVQKVVYSGIEMTLNEIYRLNNEHFKKNSSSRFYIWTSDKNSPYYPAYLLADRLSKFPEFNVPAINTAISLLRSQQDLYPNKSENIRMKDSKTTDQKIISYHGILIADKANLIIRTD